MARSGVNYRQLEQFANKLQRELQGRELEEFLKGAVKFLTAQFLAYVIPKTPVDDKNKYHRGGTLRRNWIAGKGDSSFEKKELTSNDVTPYVEEFMTTVSVMKLGNSKYLLRVKNNTEYASYVEYGHRTRGGNGYVPPQHFMTDTEAEIDGSAVRMLEDLLEEKLKNLMR